MSISSAKSTPMVEQYQRIKSQNPDSLLLFRLGDFYELFYEDAQQASKILGITLTSRRKDDGAMPMCGVPYHAAERYVAQLVREGHAVAICDQVEDPKFSKGVVKREVVRIVTPGTVTDPEELNGLSSNFLASIAELDGKWSVAHVDLSTGQFRVTELGSESKAMDELERVAPAELLCPDKSKERLFTDKFQKNPSLSRITFRDSWIFSLERCRECLCRQFGTQDLKGYDLDERRAAVAAAGAILFYLEETQKAGLAHITGITCYSTDMFMGLDEDTRRHLELLASSLNERKHSLLGVLDHCETPMGKRLLADWIKSPCLEREILLERLQRVRYFKEEAELRTRLGEKLSGIQDIERLTGKIGCGSAHARDLRGLADSLKRVPECAVLLSKDTFNPFKHLLDDFNSSQEVVRRIDTTLTDEPPISMTEGGLIREGISQELDELKSVRSSGKGWLRELEVKEMKRTGIQSLKVRYNRIMGYYIEITKPNLSLVPENYIRKQTLTNCERFITEELKEHEALVLNADDKIKEMEYEIFCHLRSELALWCDPLMKIARTVAELDVFRSLAEAAERFGYVEPELVEQSMMEIRQGRHPVLERMNNQPSFVPNDLFLNQSNRQILVITGPNMAGKSTYIRQAALILLMAQIGSFVPAQSATLGLVDRVFTRIGASDILTRGMSTFMVEMSETARILNACTPKSLVILDEVGRGTSTYDGISIASAIVEYLHEDLNHRSLALFATHYHELSELADTFPRVHNMNVQVKEWGDRVAFLYTVAEGPADHSYGIQVARLAGIPGRVITRAKNILRDLERDGIRRGHSLCSIDQRQLSFLDFAKETHDRSTVDPHPLLERIRDTDVNLLTPLQALQLLHEWQGTLKKGKHSVNPI